MAKSTEYEALLCVIFLFSLSGPSILFGTLFSNALKLYSSHNVRYEVSHPYKTAGKIKLLNKLNINIIPNNHFTDCL